MTHIPISKKVLYYMSHQQQLELVYLKKKFLYLGYS